MQINDITQPEPEVRPAPYRPVTSTLESRIGVTEASTFGLVPSGLVYAGAFAASDDKEAAHWAVVIARELDLPAPAALSKKEKKKVRPVLDPYTGNGISLRRAAQLFSLGTQLPGLLADTGQRRRSPPDAKLVSKYLTSMHVVGDASADVALSFAIDMSKRQTNPLFFDANLKALAKWNEASNSITDDEALLLARWWADNRQSVITPADALSLVDPVVTGTIQKLQAGLGGGSRASVGTQAASAAEIDQLLQLRATRLENPNYLKDAQTILNRMEAPTWFDRTLSWVSTEVLRPIFFAGQRAFVEVEGVLRPEVYALAAALPGGQTPAEAWKQALDYRSFQIQRLNAGISLGQQYYQDGLLPVGWMAPAFDFIVGWATDPFILGGKVLQGWRAGRIAPELLTPNTVARIFTPDSLKNWWADKVQAVNFGGSIDRFATSADARRGLEALYSSPEDLIRWNARLTTSIEARSAMDYEYLRLAQKALLAKYPVMSEKAWAEWQDILRAQFPIKPPVGSLAEEVVGLRQGRVASSVDRILNRPEQLTFDAAGEMDNLIEEATTPLIARLEVPHRLLPVPGFGAGKLAAMRIAESGFGDSSVGRAYRTIFNKPPSNIFKPSVDPQAFLFRRGTMWRAFTEPELRTYQVQATDIITSGVSTERRLVSLVEKMDTEAMTRIFEGHGWGEQQVIDGIANITNRFRQGNLQEAFGVIDEGKASIMVRAPLTETQLVDEVFLADPILIRTMARRYEGTLQQLVRSAASNFGGIIPEEVMGKLAAQAFKTVDVSNEILHDVMRTWKFLVVPRPAYIPRVILFDENARFIATVGSVLDRVASQELKFLPRAVRDKLDEALATRITVGDSVITVPRAGTLGYEPLAAQAFRNEDLLDDLLRKTATGEDVLKASGSYGRVVASDVQHAVYWQRALNLQLGNSDAGRIALGSVASGDSVAETAIKLKAWARGPGFITYTTRIGYGDDIDQWANYLARITHNYTLGRADIADAAIAGAVSEDILASIPQELRPTIHGPLTDVLSASAGRNVFKRFVENWYSWWVRHPEDILNRQPYYKLWKTRAEKSYWRMLGVQDVSTVSDSMRAAVDAGSRDFALAQVKKVMFDFTENTRLGELLAGVIPFSQPWAEAYAAWGHILLQRNPALLGYVRNLWDLGRNSGFIQQDPDTGAYSIPWSWTMRALSWLPFINDLPAGVGLNASMTSFNMFFSSSIDVSGVAIPAPSLAPWAAIPLKAFFAKTQNPYLASYLFNYGPGTPIISAWMERAARALWPGAFSDQRDISTAQDFLRLYQYLGTDKDSEGNLIPRAQLEARARSDAKRINALLSVTGLLFPAAGRVTWPEGLQAKEAELNHLRDIYGFQVGTDKFLQENPNLTLLTIGKTVTTRALDGIESVRLPGTADVSKLLSQPGFERFAKQDSWAAAAIVLSLDSQWDESSMQAFSDQIHEGSIKYKGLDRFLSEGQSPGFWNAIDALSSWYYPAKEHLDSQGLSVDNAEVIALDRRRRQELYDIYLRYPDKAKQEGFIPRLDAQGIPIGEVDWTSTDNHPPSEIVQAHLRELTTFTGFETFPTMLGLKAYFLARDKMAAQMSKLAIDNIYGDSAKREGLTAEWDKQKAAIIAEFPDAEVFITKFLDNDLTGIESAGDRKLRIMSQRNPGRYADYQAFDTQWEKILDSATGTPGLSQEEKNARYEAARSYVNSLYEKGPNGKDSSWMLEAWYESKSYSAQQQYIGTLINRPVIFYSRFDFSLMGLKLSDRATGWLDEVSKANAQIDKLDAEALRQGKDLTTTPMHEAVDKWVREHLGKDKSFAAAVEAINTWGWPLWQPEAGYLSQDGKAGWAWNTLHDLTISLNDQIRALGWHGDGLTFGDKREQGAYALARDALAERIAEYAAWSDVFDEQVKQLQKDYLRGTGLQYYLMPEIYFELAPK